MKFSTLQELEQAFMQDFDFPDTMQVGDTFYDRKNSMSLEEALVRGMGAMIYEAKDLQQGAIALVWHRKKNRLLPVNVLALTEGFISEGMGAPGMMPEEGDSRVIGDVVDVKITSLPNSKTIKGKVDTGATISSLHAERYKVNKGQVEFVCPALSNNVITAPLLDQQAVKSADGGTEYRPVIELNIKVNDKPMSKQQFNLNDRGAMEHPILLGQNVLEKGGFMIDPRMNEDTQQWQAIVELAYSMPPLDSGVEQLYDTIKNSSVSFDDLFRYIAGKVADKNIE